MRNKSSVSSMNLVEENGMRGVKGQKSYDKSVLVDWFLFFCYNRKMKFNEKNRKKAFCNENYWIPFRLL